MKAIDLHTHTTKSDGTYSPTALVDYGIEKGLSAVAITDHDTVDGLQEAIDYSKDKPIEVIPGIEFSTQYQDKDIHIVGLYIDAQCEAFQKPLKEFVASRENRNEKMCAKLREAGIPITFDLLKKENPGAVITRAHYAKFLVSRGIVSSNADAFSKYLGDHTPYFIPREKVTPNQAIALIHAAGGVAILAHPPLYHMGNDRLNELVSQLKKDGLDGIECIYSTYTNQDERDMRNLSLNHDLIISGGSDFHGKNKPGLDLGCGYGNLFVPEDILLPIKTRYEQNKLISNQKM